MSEGAVHRELLAFLLRQRPGEVAERDLVAAIDAARGGPLGFLYGAALEAGCDAATARARAAGCYACFAAGNVADDLADGDCTYLDDPVATGPAVEFVLIHAAYGLWLGPGGVEPETAARVARRLTQGASRQLVEVRTEKFTLGVTRDIAMGMGGSQYAAYLEIAWDGSALSARADEAGTGLGNAGFVAEDRRSADERYTDLPSEDRRALLAWARDELGRAAAIELPCMAAVVRYVAPLLEGEP